MAGSDVTATRHQAYRLFVYIVLLVSLGGMGTVITLNFIVDPFNMNDLFHFGFDKKLISYRSNYRLYKIIEFNKHPIANILLGDSRMEALRTDLIDAATGQEYFNFAYGGGTLYEAIDTFWYAASIVKLKNVYIGINFNTYNKMYGLTLVPEAIDIARRPLTYYASPFIAKISLYNIIYHVSGVNLASEHPPMSKEAFWAQRLGEATDHYYGTYIYPQDAVDELRKIKQYSIDNGIALTFVIFPTHVELQRKVEEYGLEQEYVRYKSDLASIAPTIDFDYPNAWTEDRQLFIDPYHTDSELMPALIDEIWGRHLHFGKMLPLPEAETQP